MTRSVFAGACVTAFVIFLITAEASAQRGMHWPGSGGWGPGTAYGRMYDPKTVTRLQGTVAAVDTFAHRGMSRGVHVLLETSRDSVWVHLGPQWFVSAQDTKIAAGDSIVEVAQSMVETRQRRRPVVEGGRLVGQVSSNNILWALMEHSRRKRFESRPPTR